VFEAAVRDPDSLAEHPSVQALAQHSLLSPFRCEFMCESLLYVAYVAYQAVTGKQLELTDVELAQLPVVADPWESPTPRRRPDGTGSTLACGGCLSHGCSRARGPRRCKGQDGGLSSCQDGSCPAGSVSVMIRGCPLLRPVSRTRDGPGSERVCCHVPGRSPANVSGQRRQSSRRRQPGASVRHQASDARGAVRSPAPPSVASAHLNSLCG
jgi:hypothetical protein